MLSLAVGAAAVMDASIPFSESCMISHNLENSCHLDFEVRMVAGGRRSRLKVAKSRFLLFAAVSRPPVGENISLLAISRCMSDVVWLDIAAWSHRFASTCLRPGSHRWPFRDM